MPSQPVEGVMGAGRAINMDGEGKTMVDARGREAQAMTLVVWMVAAIAGRWRHG